MKQTDDDDRYMNNVDESALGGDVIQSSTEDPDLEKETEIPQTAVMRQEFRKQQMMELMSVKTVRMRVPMIQLL